MLASLEEGWAEDGWLSGDVGLGWRWESVAGWGSSILISLGSAALVW
jgi:hypothetical protein